MTRENEAHAPFPRCTDSYLTKQGGVGREGREGGGVTLFTLFAYSHRVVSVVTSNLPVGDSLGEDQCSTRDSLGLWHWGLGCLPLASAYQRHRVLETEACLAGEEAGNTTTLVGDWREGGMEGWRGRVGEKGEGGGWGERDMWHH